MNENNKRNNGFNNFLKNKRSSNLNINRDNNYRKIHNLIPPRYNNNDNSVEDENIQQEEQNESRLSQAKNKIEDISGKIEKTKKVITFLGKYKIIIIVGCIVFFILILFMLIIMSLELGDDKDNGGGSSSLSSPTTSYLTNVYEECQSVNVNGELYDLEEYVAGVVTAENIVSIANIEALKAHAIAARTYAIDRTNNCQISIDNSSKAQNFTSDILDKARQAANETAGVVLTYDGKVFDSEYDSYCIDDTECPDSICNGDTCSVTYSKKPNGEKHQITISSSWSVHFVPGYGHARGMSQLLSYQMAEEGSTYEEILKFFYSPGVVLSQLTKKSTGINSNVSLLPFNIRNTRPTSSDWAWSGEYYGSNVGQCIWYAKGRMIEILNEAISDVEKKNSSINVINSTYGNACQWYNQSLLNTFGGSSDVNDYRIGSLIVWKYAGSECNDSSTNNYGHVAIIENITEDGKVTVSEGYAAGGNSCPETWDCVRTLVRNFNTIEEFTNWVNNYKNAGGTQYDFLGYIHILG